MILPRYSVLIPTLVVLSYGVYQACLEPALGDECATDDDTDEAAIDILPRIVVKVAHTGKSSLRKARKARPTKRVHFQLPLACDTHQDDHRHLNSCKDMVLAPTTRPRRHSTGAMTAGPLVV